MRPSPTNTPVCPNCKSKFSHSMAMRKCTKCGLPDEVAELGPRGIARWRKQEAKRRGDRTKKIVASTRKKNKHGRKGVAR